MYHNYREIDSMLMVVTLITMVRVVALLKCTRHHRRNGVSTERLVLVKD